MNAFQLIEQIDLLTDAQIIEIEKSEEYISAYNSMHGSPETWTNSEILSICQRLPIRVSAVLYSNLRAISVSARNSGRQAIQPGSQFKFFGEGEVYSFRGIDNARGIVWYSEIGDYQMAQRRASIDGLILV